MNLRMDFPISAKKKIWDFGSNYILSVDGFG